MDAATKDDAIAKVLEELNRANRMYGTSFASAHEGYAVILEELDERFEEIRKKHPDKQRLREEAVQVGAMAIKFIMSLCQESIGLEEAKCRTCLFKTMTINHRKTLGEDPCDHCSGSSRWVNEVTLSER